GVSLDGTAFFYTNTLRQLDPMPAELRWPRHRQKSIGCFCCPPNVARTLAQASTYAYATSERGVYVALYGGSTLDAAGFKLTQTTDYPWDGNVRIAIDAPPSRESSIYLRIPAWAASATVRVNDRAEDAPARPGTFYELRRTWKAGDRIDLDLPMPVRLVEA